MTFGGHINLSIIANIFCKVIDYLCAKFNSIRSSNRNTTNIFQFLTIFANFIPIQLGIIDQIFMTYDCAKFYIYALTNADMTNSSSFLGFLHKIWLFRPKMSNFVHIKPVIVVYILYKVINFPSANFDNIWSSSVNTTNILQFLTIRLFYPKKWEVPHFQEVYRTFFQSGDPKDEIWKDHLLS